MVDLANEGCDRIKVLGLYEMDSVKSTPFINLASSSGDETTVPQ